MFIFCTFAIKSYVVFLKQGSVKLELCSLHFVVVHLFLFPLIHSCAGKKCTNVAGVLHKLLCFMQESLLKKEGL